MTVGHLQGIVHISIMLGVTSGEKGAIIVLKNIDIPKVYFWIIPDGITKSKRSFLPLLKI